MGTFMDYGDEFFTEVEHFNTENILQSLGTSVILKVSKKHSQVTSPKSNVIQKGIYRYACS